MSLLKFQPFSSKIDYAFWQELSRRKLDSYKLSEASVPLVAQWSNARGSAKAPFLLLSRSSFDEVQPQSAAEWNAEGELINVNTAEAFAAFDRKALWERTLSALLHSIESGEAAAQPSMLTRWFVISFSDLKRYKFYYWCCFPALLPPTNIVLSEEARSLQSAAAAAGGDGGDGAPYASLFSAFAAQSQWAAFCREEKGEFEVASLEKGPSFCGETPCVVVADPGTTSLNPGWPLRNLLFMLAAKWKVSSVKVYCLRSNSAADSFVFTATLPAVDLKEPPRGVGWEKNKKGKLKHRYVNLASHMDPTRLAATAVDLNLKLMRWRLAPSLDLQRIASTKCLLLGSGTLGCNVARALLGWGVRNVSFVDSGKVSFSNPVRQTLFEFKDCLDGGRPKAEAAAEHVKQIFPDCNAKGYQLEIAMPGHPIAPDDAEKAKAAYDTLQRLVDEHDVVFLLTDSREARWLGSVMGAASGKIVMNCALGFDTFLVMRHGNRSRGDCTLGCYFCNDVVAPTDSLRERTLDQQCTVTRPGVSFMASALAIELLVSLLQHPELDSAPADVLEGDAASQLGGSESLGLVPHQIRGFLGNYQNLLIVGHAYDKCTACSKPVLDEFKANGFEFVKKVCETPAYIEEITGLTEMKEESVDWEVCSEGDDFDME